jgi:hypothetical protein
VSPGDVIVRFDGVRKTRRGWTARCPAHDDRRQSLSIAIGDDDRTLLNCFAGCRFESIVRAVGLRPCDLFQTGSESRESSPRSAKSEADQARREAFREAQRQLRRIERHCDSYEEADSIRICDRVVQRVRAILTPLGPRDDVWPILAAVASLETWTRMAEARLDAA